MDDLIQKGSKAFTWDFVGNLINQGSSFIISIFLARLLTPADFGLLGMAVVFIGFSEAFIDFGFSNALIQKKNTTAEQFSTVFYLNLSIGALLTTIMFFSSGFIAEFYKNSKLINIVQVLSVLFIISSFNLVQKAQLTRKLRFDILTKTDIVSSAISGTVGVIMAFAGFGVWSLVSKNILGALLRVIIIWNYSDWRPQRYFNLRSIKEHANYGYKMFLSGFLNNIYSKVDVLIIGKFFSATSLGLYYRAQSFHQLIVRYTSSSLSKVLFPVYSEIQNDVVRVKEITSKLLNLLSFIIFGLTGLIYLCGEDLIVLLFGSKWIPAVPYFKILILCAFSYPVSSVLVTVISGLGNSRAFLKAEIVKKILLTVGIPVGFYFGIEGYLYALVCIGFLGTSVNMWYVKKQIKYTLREQYKDVFIYLIPASLISITVYFFLNSFQQYHLVHLVLSTILFSFGYLLLNYLIKANGLRLFYKLFRRYFLKRIPIINQTL